MEVLKSGDGGKIYDKVVKCETCGCVFHGTIDDLYYYYENAVQHKFYECPECYTLIPVSTISFLHVVRNEEEREEDEDS